MIFAGVWFSCTFFALPSLSPFDDPPPSRDTRRRRRARAPISALTYCSRDWLHVRARARTPADARRRLRRLLRLLHFSAFVRSGTSRSTRPLRCNCSWSSSRRHLARKATPTPRSTTAANRCRWFDGPNSTTPRIRTRTRLASVSPRDYSFAIHLQSHSYACIVYQFLFLSTLIRREEYLFTISIIFASNEFVHIFYNNIFIYIFSCIILTKIYVR